MLSNTFVVSEFVEILYSFPTWSCVNMCHTVQRPVPRTWQCVMWYHDQCISPRIMWYDTTTSVFHLAMHYAVPRPVQPNNVLCVPRPVSFNWRCLMRYHDQCNLAIYVIRYHNQYITPGNVLCVPQPVYFTWQYVIQYHDQCLSPGNVSCSTTTSAA